MSDPTAIEIQIMQLHQDRKDYLEKRKYKDLSLPAFIEKMRATYSYLNTSSKTLFDKVIAGDLDNPEAQARVKQMLYLMRTIQDGKRTQDDADKLFGKVMADRYVKPVVDNLPTPSLADEPAGN
jgi:hypothetical protein